MTAENLQDEIMHLIQDAMPEPNEHDVNEIESYLTAINDLHSSIMTLLPSKQAITPDNLPKSDTPLWLWLKHSERPILANFRTDYPRPLFWGIVDGDYNNYSGSIDIDKATHFMYLNKPE